MPTKRSKKTETVAVEQFKVADQHAWCYCHMGPIDEGQPIYQRDNRPVCRQCRPLYDLRRPAHAGGTTSKAVKRRKTA